MVTIEDMVETDLKCPACGEKLYHNPYTSGELVNPTVDTMAEDYPDADITEGFEFRCKKCWADITISEDQMEEHGIE